MDSANINKFIDTVPFFKDFSEHEKSKLTSHDGSFKQFGEKDCVFLEGDEGASLFVVLYGSIDLYKLGDAGGKEGHVSLKNEKENLVGSLSTGAVFGEISMLTGRKRSVTARVSSSKAVLMEISMKFVDTLLHSIQAKFHKQLLIALVQDLDDMDTRYIKLQSSIQNEQASCET